MYTVHVLLRARCAGELRVRVFAPPAAGRLAARAARRHEPAAAPARLRGVRAQGARRAARHRRRCARDSVRRPIIVYEYIEMLDLRAHVALVSPLLLLYTTDFPRVDFVVQLDCPEDANTYIHRAGRTARCVSYSIHLSTRCTRSPYSTLYSSIQCGTSRLQCTVQYSTVTE